MSRKDDPTSMPRASFQKSKGSTTTGPTPLLLFMLECERNPELYAESMRTWHPECQRIDRRGEGKA
ncbi:hypothetical protein SAMN05421742_1373 [Roseospirillum parvum]|uniref:Uncharacterized protein n=1 Tax=Roseospirillum parvum TaxID=83401 RepID=A0A1G8GQP4_9PROT|nr:hypothetical protein SAMN05421742_1373 [Roseospirillum parvum]